MWQLEEVGGVQGRYVGCPLMLGYMGWACCGTEACVRIRGQGYTAWKGDGVERDVWWLRSLLAVVGLGGRGPMIASLEQDIG